VSDLFLPVYTYASSVIIKTKIWRFGKGYNKMVDCEMLFDTGASMTTLDVSLVKRAGYSLSDARETTVTGIGKDDIPCKQIVIPHLVLGGYDVGAVFVSVIEFSEKSNTSAVLGMNVIRYFKTIIDIDIEKEHDFEKPNGQITLIPKFDITEKPSFDNFIPATSRFGIWSIQKGEKQ
jgi:hypothetical protein